MLFDLHNDLLTSGYSEAEIEEYLGQYKNVRKILAYWTSKTEDPLTKIRLATEKYSFFENVLFSVEDVWFLTEETVEDFCALPLSYCTLAWNGENAIAGGHCCGAGLTEKGFKIARIMHDSGIILDTAHLSEKSFCDVTENFENVLNSHTAQKSIFDHSRNISDRQIKILIEKNGLIGLTLVNQFMGPHCGIDGFVRQIDTFAQKFGIGNLAVGTDFFGTEPVEGLKNYESFWFLEFSLLKNGYTQEQIDRIFYLNADRFFKEKCRRITYE